MKSVCANFMNTSVTLKNQLKSKFQSMRIYTEPIFP